MIKDYEKTVISALTSGILSPSVISHVIQEGEFLSYEYTGSGYFISIRHPDLPDKRVVCDLPITGEADGIVCGFLIFIENGRLLFECHSWGELEVPEDFRTRNVQINLVPQD